MHLSPSLAQLLVAALAVLVVLHGAQSMPTDGDTAAARRDGRRSGLRRTHSLPKFLGLGPYKVRSEWVKNTSIFGERHYTVRPTDTSRGPIAIREADRPFSQTVLADVEGHFKEESTPGGVAVLFKAEATAPGTPLARLSRSADGELLQADELNRLRWMLGQDTTPIETAKFVTKYLSRERMVAFPNYLRGPEAAVLQEPYWLTVLDLAGHRALLHMWFRSWFQSQELTADVLSGPRPPHATRFSDWLISSEGAYVVESEVTRKGEKKIAYSIEDLNKHKLTLLMTQAERDEYLVEPMLDDLVYRPSPSASMPKDASDIALYDEEHLSDGGATLQSIESELDTLDQPVSRRHEGYMSTSGINFVGPTQLGSFELAHSIHQFPHLKYSRLHFSSNPDFECSLVSDTAMMAAPVGPILRATARPLWRDRDTLIYVMDTKYNLYVARPEVGAFSHLSLMAGLPVFSAGRIRIHRGDIVYLDNVSDEYRVPVVNFRTMIHVLYNWKLDLTRLAWYEEQ